MSNESVILLRTHTDGPDVYRSLDRLRQQSGRRVYVVADERAKLLNFPAAEKIPLTSGILEQFGLHVADDVGWRCGDYFLYIAAEKLRNAKYVWMIEPDVYINFESIGEFFDMVDERSDADFIAPRFRRAAPSWSWFPRMAVYREPVFFCLFSLVRVSARAISLLLAERILMSRMFREQRVDLGFPNDESFVATTLCHHRLPCEDINSFGDFCLAENYGWRPLYEPFMQGQPKDNRIYHPVVEGSTFIRRARWCRRYLNEEENQKLTDHIIRVASVESSELMRNRLLSEFVAGRQSVNVEA